MYQALSRRKLVSHQACLPRKTRGYLEQLYIHCMKLLLGHKKLNITVCNCQKIILCYVPYQSVVGYICPIHNELTQNKTQKDFFTKFTDVITSTWHFTLKKSKNHEFPRKTLQSNNIHMPGSGWQLLGCLDLELKFSDEVPQQWQQRSCTDLTPKNTKLLFECCIPSALLECSKVNLFIQQF